MKNRFALLLIALLVTALTGFAQSSTATISGSVVDEKEAVIANATLTAVNEASRLTRKTTTNSGGYFTLPVLPPGNYTLTVEQTGFAPLRVSDVVLNVNDERTLRLTMKVGGVGDTITIKGEDLGAIKESPEVSTVVDQQFVANLPLNGRSFQSLIALTPGIVRTNTEGQFSVNGQRDNANYFTIDGVSGNVGIGTSRLSLGQAGAGQIPGFNSFGGTNGLVSVDAMQEFRIQSSTYAAEFGRTPGGQIQIVTRSGSNQLHGSAFDYFRNDALDANNWFNNARLLRKAPLRQNDFGGVLGGPIVLPQKVFGPLGYDGRQHTFFFVSYEGLRLRLPVTVASVRVPSLALRNSAAEAVRPYLNAMPLPNGADLGFGATAFNAAFSNPTTLDATSVRLDHNFNSQVTVFGRYNVSPSVSTTRSAATPTTLTNTKKNARTFTLGTTQTITSRVVNEFRGNYSRNAGSSVFTNDNFGGAVPLPDALLFPQQFANPATDTVDINAALQGLALTRGSSVANTQRQLNLVDNLTWVKGAHALKFGADYRHLFPIAQPRSYALSLNFFDLPAVQSATPSLVQVSQNDRVRVSAKNLSLYGQDTWRAAKRLTLDFGLRWEFNPPPQGMGGDVLYTVNNVNDAANVLLAPAGTPLYHTVKNAFAPRVGAAYKLRGTGGWETVLRGGFGTFYDLGSGSALDTTGTFPHQRVRFTQQSGATAAPLPLPSALIAPPALPSLAPPYTGQNLLGFDPNYSLPRTYQWNVAVEQGVGKNQTLTASYVGSAGRKLLRQERQLPPSTQSNRFLNLYVYRNSDGSDYDALQLQFTRRLTKGFQALANYSFSKALDTASTDAPPSSSPGAGATQLNVAGERGRSTFDITHVLNATISYDLPALSRSRPIRALFGGWSTDAIFTARNGLPINVIVTRDLGFGTGFAARPDLISGTAVWIDDPIVAGGRKLNRAAFAIPTERRQGYAPAQQHHRLPVYATRFRGAPSIQLQRARETASAR